MPPCFRLFVKTNATSRFDCNYSKDAERCAIFTRKIIDSRLILFCSCLLLLISPSSRRITKEGVTYPRKPSHINSHLTFPPYLSQDSRNIRILCNFYLQNWIRVIIILPPTHIVSCRVILRIRKFSSILFPAMATF